MSGGKICFRGQMISTQRHLLLQKPSKNMSGFLNVIIDMHKCQWYCVCVYMCDVIHHNTYICWFFCSCYYLCSKLSFYPDNNSERKHEGFNHPSSSSSKKKNNFTCCSSSIEPIPTEALKGLFHSHTPTYQPVATQDISHH